MVRCIERAEGPALLIGPATTMADMMNITPHYTLNYSDAITGDNEFSAAHVTSHSRSSDANLESTT